MKITGIEIKQYAKPLDPPFLASWDPNPRVKFASTMFMYTQMRELQESDPAI